MGLFDALGIGYSGLSTSQSGITTTSHNISNANTEGYSRQRVEQKVNYPISNLPGDVGNGVQVEEIARIHDEFVYGRLKSSSASLEYFSFTEQNLKEIASGFSDLDNLDIDQDLKNFYSGWSNFSRYPDDESAKIEVVSSMNSLTTNLNEAHDRLTDMQDRLNEEFVDGIDAVNDMAQQIVELNKNINKVENVKHNNANDLRDQRDQLELKMAKLVNISVFKGNMGENGLSVNTDAGNAYTINIAGHNIVDGENAHLLDASIQSNTTKLTSVFITDHNQVKTDITGKISGGKLGALVDLRGDGIDSVTGKATHSKIQDYIDNLDSFTKAFTQKVDSIYASTSQDKLTTEDMTLFDDDDSITDHSDINEGTFNVIIYDNAGNEVAKRAITIDKDTALNDGSTDSILGQLTANMDDNNDNDGTNDFDDLFHATLVTDPNNPHVLQIQPNDDNGLYTIGFDDNGTNFAGVTGINRLFTNGDSADHVSVRNDIVSNPSHLSASKAPIEGNSDLAQDMINLQYEELSFTMTDGSKLTQTAEDFYRYTTTMIASDAQNATTSKDASEALWTTINEEMQSVSGVDMDEELMNLMKYQTAYQASAKIITTVDEMINTLLGIKQ